MNIIAALANVVLALLYLVGSVYLLAYFVKALADEMANPYD